MTDMGASVLARLKSKSAESGRSYQLCMQLFCQEEFLRRVEKSPYADNLVLKGGLFLYSLTNFDSRVTVDVDFLLRQMPNTPEKLQTILEEIIQVDTGNFFVTFHNLKKLYHGYCQLCGNRPFNVDTVDICEAHHIEYFSDSHNNNASNIVIICPNHHRMIHKCSPSFDEETHSFIYSDGRIEPLKINFHL